MGRFLKRLFGRPKRIELKIDSVRKTEKTHFIEISNEISGLNMRLEAIEKKLDEVLNRLPEQSQTDEHSGEKVTAKQLLNEYLYGEHGDE